MKSKLPTDIKEWEEHFFKLSKGTRYALWYALGLLLTDEKFTEEYQHDFIEYRLMLEAIGF